MEHLGIEEHSTGFHADDFSPDSKSLRPFRAPPDGDQLELVDEVLDRAGADSTGETDPAMKS